jgi:hypothetical protein
MSELPREVYDAMRLCVYGSTICRGSDEHTCDAWTLCRGNDDARTALTDALKAKELAEEAVKVLAHRAAACLEVSDCCPTWFEEGAEKEGECDKCVQKQVDAAYRTSRTRMEGER